MQSDDIGWVFCSLFGLCRDFECFDREQNPSLLSLNV